MLLQGRCHCCNIAFELAWNPDPQEIPARACACSFCRRHGNVWTSMPQGVLTVSIGQLSLRSVYQFGTATADFQVCARCGVVPLVTSSIEGRLYAVVNVNTLEGVDPQLLRPVPASFDGQTVGSRLQRRQQGWIGQVVYR